MEQRQSYLRPLNLRIPAVIGAVIVPVHPESLQQCLPFGHYVPKKSADIKARRVVLMLCLIGIEFIFNK